MLGIISKLFGGNKSDKDVKRIRPIVEKTNTFFASYATLTNDQLRSKTAEFRERIREHLKESTAEIDTLNASADALPFNELNEKDQIYQQVDKLKKEKNKKIEEILEEILPEAFAL